MGVQTNMNRITDSLRRQTHRYAGFPDMPTLRLGCARNVGPAPLVRRPSRRLCAGGNLPRDRGGFRRKPETRLIVWCNSSIKRTRMSSGS